METPIPLYLVAAWFGATLAIGILFGCVVMASLIRMRSHRINRLLTRRTFIHRI